MKLTSQMRKILKQMESGAYIREARDTFMEKSKWFLQDEKTIYAQVTELMIGKLFQTGLIEQWFIPVNRQGKQTNEDLYCLVGKLPEEFSYLKAMGEEPNRLEVQE